MGRALSLFENSEYLTDILVRHPEEIASLAEYDDAPLRVGSAYFFDELLGGRHISGDPIFAHVASAAGSHNEKLSLLRRHYRHRVFQFGRARSVRTS